MRIQHNHTIFIPQTPEGRRYADEVEELFKKNEQAYKISVVTTVIAIKWSDEFEVE